MTLPISADWLRLRATLTPDRFALISNDGRWTFRELHARTESRIAELAAAGIAPGDVVALLAKNSAAYVTIVHALQVMGAVLVPLNTRLTVAELHFQITDCHPKLLLADESHFALAESACSGTFTYCQLLSSVVRRPSSAIPNNQLPITNPHSILYTSGTTGNPKGVCLTLANHWWSAIGSALNLGIHADDGWLVCLPLFHVGGLSTLFKSVIYGMTVVLHSGFDAEAVNRAIDEERVTMISVVSTMLQRMLAARGDAPYPAWLRCVLLGGGPAPKDLLEECARRNIPVTQTYGLTEAASQVATLAPEDALKKLGSAGKPLFGNEIRIEATTDDGRPTTENGPTIGEIMVRGPSVMQGYLNRPEATAHTLRDGWLHTGDLGYLDGDGYLYVLDRRDDLIISGGENVYPAEIESVLRQHPAVADVGVIAKADAQWGQVPIAFVQLQADANPDELRLFCISRLAKFKIPAEFHFVEALPRNASGKLLRRALHK